MPPLIYASSDSEDNETMHSAPAVKLFGRKKAMHSVLGGGKVADLLLWKNKYESAALIVGLSLIWFLFEVVEYNFVTLFCHISITIMLVVFIWCNGAEFFNWNQPKIPPSLLHERTFHDYASTFHRRFSQALSVLVDIACGKDPVIFILAIISLYILSVVGTYFTFLNLFYFGSVCLLTLPFLYDRYEDEVDYYIGKLIQQGKKTYKRFDSRVLNKIPRATGKDKKAA